MKQTLTQLLVLSVVTSMHAGTAFIRWGEPENSVRLGVVVDGPTARLTLENVGRTPVRVLSHIQAGQERHYDALTLLAVDADGVVHQMSFVDARDRSGAIYETVAPGQSYSDEIDLEKWNQRAVTKYKFQEGAVYTLIFSYNDRPWSVSNPGTRYSPAVRVRYASGKFIALP